MDILDRPCGFQWAGGEPKAETGLGPTWLTTSVNAGQTLLTKLCISNFSLELCLQIQR